MLNVTECPICSSRSLRSLRKFVVQPNDSIPEGSLQDYLRLRRRILFEVWQAPAEGLRLDVLICKECGFVCYSPRPTEDELAAKYRFLQIHEVSIGGTTSPETDDVRANQMFERIRPHLGDGRKVLDCGGGTGKLMKPWLHAGYDVSLVDYSETAIEGVKRRGNTLDDLDGDLRFDLIISAHVLEHLVDPVSHLKRMLGFLKEDGVVYAEVPFELVPYMDRIGSDPVTHLNFFSPDSFSRLAAVAGSDVLQAFEGDSTYSGWPIRFLAFVGKRGEDAAPISSDGYRKTMRYLTPSLRLRVKRAIGR